MDPDLNYVWWSTQTVAPPLSLNMARNSDPRIQTALTAGRSTTEKADRIKAYQQVNQYLAQDLPYLFAMCASEDFRQRMTRTLDLDETFDKLLQKEAGR